jgi:hypothetical protein
MIVYKLHNLLNELLENGSIDLVTRQSGELIRTRIEQDIQKENERSLVAIDFTDTGIIDYSCADEIIAKLVSRLVSGEYGDRYFFLSGLNENHRENIEVALERKDLAVIAEMITGERVLLGNLNNYLKETLELTEKQGKLTSKMLCDIMGLEASTGATRLLNLYKKRLVKRVEETRESGRIWVYEQL